jgi:hypothetical protein
MSNKQKTSRATLGKVPQNAMTVRQNGMSVRQKR